MIYQGTIMASCRICYGDSSEINPLIDPCECKGSVQFIHRRCLYTWLHIATRNQCELCNTTYEIEEFRFETLYRLPTHRIRLNTRVSLVFISMFLLDALYTVATEHTEFTLFPGIIITKPLTFLRLWLILSSHIPYLLITVSLLQGFVFFPLVYCLNNKYRYMTYLCSSRQYGRYHLTAPICTIFLLFSFIISFSFSMIGAFVFVSVLSHMYNLHCAIIEQINTDKLKGLLLTDHVIEEVEDVEEEEEEEEEILDDEDLDDPMDVMNA